MALRWGAEMDNNAELLEWLDEQEKGFRGTQSFIPDKFKLLKKKILIACSMADALDGMLYDIGCNDEKCQQANHKEAHETLMEWKSS